MSFGYLVFTHFSGECISSQGKAAKPVGTYTFSLEETNISLRGRPGRLSHTAGVQGAGVGVKFAQPHGSIKGQT